MLKLFTKYMILIILSFNFLSCKRNVSNEQSKVKKIQVSGDDVEYHKLKGNNGEYVRFYGDSRDTLSVIVLNPETKIKSEAIFYRKDQTLEMSIKYENNEKYAIRTDYRKNGTVKYKCFYINNKPVVKKFYNLHGKLINYRELLSFDNNWIRNIDVYFSINGKIKKDISFYFSIFPNIDTLQINDSLNLQFILFAPSKFSKRQIISGNINKEFVINQNNSKILVIKNKKYMYKPSKIGNDTLRFAAELYSPNDSIASFILLEKTFFIKDTVKIK